MAPGRMTIEWISGPVEFDIVRQRRGYYAEIAQDISPDAACRVCGHPVEIVWTFAGYSADIVRTLRDVPPYF